MLRCVLSLTPTLSPNLRVWPASVALQAHTLVSSSLISIVQWSRLAVASSSSCSTWTGMWWGHLGPRVSSEASATLFTQPFCWAATISCSVTGLVSQGSNFWRGNGASLALGRAEVGNAEQSQGGWEPLKDVFINTAGQPWQVTGLSRHQFASCLASLPPVLVDEGLALQSPARKTVASLLEPQLPCSEDGTDRRHIYRQLCCPTSIPPEGWDFLRGKKFPHCFTG